MKFILVTHSWFVEGKGFDYNVIEADSLELANKEGVYQAAMKSGRHTRCAHSIIPIAPSSYQKNIKLTIWQRITGILPSESICAEIDLEK